MKCRNLVTKPQYGHDDDANLLPERCRHALGTDGFIGLPEQSEYGVAKLAQGTRLDTARVLIQCQRGQHARELMFQRVGVR